ncbi:MAG TPA: hypothetical protein VK066_01615 [Chloroflexota bacterium]|nr:hypothetical protein [Chloroflexota bacterium]
MSRYQVDKVLRETVLDADALARFAAGPAAYLVGRDLSAEERRALMEHDYGALYALGAHPFLLWGWAARVWALRGGDKEQFRDRYAAAVRPHGYPDYAT